MKKSLLTQEIKSMLTNKKILIPIIAVIMIPILYAGMFLFAFWDPYDQMEDLPIAVVNMDEGAFFEGEHLEIGNELVSNLKEDPDFDYHFIDDEAEAFADLLEQKYYVIIKIPENFSDHATTLLHDSPEKLDLIYIPNESFNFLSAQMGETAMLMIESALEENIIETYAETIFDKITEVADGLEKASDGTNQLNDGAFELKDGSQTLTDHLEELARKSIEFNNGVDQVYTGATQLSDGTSELSSAMEQLEDASEKLLNSSQDVNQGVVTLADGIVEIENGLQEVNINIPDLIDGTNQVQHGLKQFQQELPQQMNEKISSKLNDSSQKVHHNLEELQLKLEESFLGEDGMMQQFVDRLPDELPEEVVLEAKHTIEETVKKMNNELTNYQTDIKQNVETTLGNLEQQFQMAIDQPLNQLQEGLMAIHEGQEALHDGVNELADGTIQLRNGSNQLAQGQDLYIDQMQLFNQKLTEASSGSDQLATGASELAIGMVDLNDGSKQFSDGSHDLADGSKELTNGADKLTEGTEELNEKINEAATEAGDVHTDERTYSMMANPVEVKNEKINEVPNYGTGFAPYFLSLGLFVGALLLSIVYPLREPAEKPKHALSWFMSKFIVLTGIGILQALIATAILLIGLGLEVQSIPLFLLYAIITSLTFITLIQFFVTCFGDPGRFIAIIILILQLTTSAGTFPLELIPKSLQFFNVILPMTYSVAGFKAVVSSGDYLIMWQNVGILLGFTIIFIAGTFTYFKLMFKRKYQIHSQEEDVIISA